MPLAATGTREGLDVAAGAFASAFGPDTTSALVVAPDDPGPGAWAGGPSAVLHEGVYYLAYRLRRPVGHGRGYANVIARSEDGLRFRSIAVLHKDTFESDSLERPALVRTEDGRWRVYVSAATPGTKHWRVDLLEADSPEGLGSAPQRTVLPGSAELAVKDPVVVERHGSWHLWASRHPLDDPDQTDRMTTDYATSDDGVEWTWRGTALAGRPGQWDARGVRVAAVLLDRPTPLAFYDGRATAEENWEERTGLARVDELGTFAALGDRPIGSSPTTGTGLRYVSAVDLPDGGTRLYYEVTRPDGAHELRTTLVDHDG